MTPSAEAIRKAREIVNVYERWDDLVTKIGESPRHYLTNAIATALSVQEDEIARLTKDSLLYPGGEDDGYGGKIEPKTYKEAYEEEIGYDKWAREEMQKACDLIKSNPNWTYSPNAYPSPYERALVAGCQQAVKELRKALEELSARTSPNGDMADKAVFDFVNKLLPASSTAYRKERG